MRMETLLPAVMLLASATPAGAQPPPNPQEVVVTGTHLQAQAIDGPYPVSQVDNWVIDGIGASNIQDPLSQLPQVGAPGLSRTNTNFAGLGMVASVNVV